MSLMTDSQDGQGWSTMATRPSPFVCMWHGASGHVPHWRRARGGAGSGTQRFAPPIVGRTMPSPRYRRWLASMADQVADVWLENSWADLRFLPVTSHWESLRFQTFGFGGGRKDARCPKIYPGGLRARRMGDERYIEQNVSLIILSPPFKWDDCVNPRKAH